MRKIWILTKREYKASVRTKGFIIGLVMAPLMMGGSLIVFAVMKDRVDTTDKKIAIVDRSGVIAEALVNAAELRNEKELYDNKSGKKVKPAYFFEVVKEDQEDPAAQRLALSDRVRAGEILGFVDIGSDVVHPGNSQETASIAYYAKGSALDELRGWLNWPINSQLRKIRLEDAGISEKDVPDVFHWINVDALGLVTRDEAGGIQDAKRSGELEAILVPIILMMLMFLMIMMNAPGMLNSVMEEKTQRIAEVLLGSVSPFEFMLGKLIGGILVAFTIAVVYVVGGIIAVNQMDFQEYFPYHVLPWFFAYMSLAVIMFGAMAAALGSTCSEAKDAQSLNFPTILPALIPMFIYFPIVREPLGSFGTWASLIPLFTPTLMVLRLASPEAIPVWQPIVGLFGVLAFTVLIVWAGGRIFRVAILMQGTPPKFSNMLKWAFKG